MHESWGTSLQLRLDGVGQGDQAGPHRFGRLTLRRRQRDPERVAGEGHGQQSDGVLVLVLRLGVHDVGAVAGLRRGVPWLVAVPEGLDEGVETLAGVLAREQDDLARTAAVSAGRTAPE